MPIQVGRRGPGFRNPTRDYRQTILAPISPRLYVDSATVPIVFSVATHDCLIPWAPSWRGSTISNKWLGDIPFESKWSGIADNKWTGELGYGVEEEC